MYIYIIMKSIEEYWKDINGLSAIKDKEVIERAVKDSCLIVPYQRFTIELVEETKPKAIIMSGMAPDLQTFNKEEFKDINNVIHKKDIPFLCICGSHQLLAELYDKNIEEVEKVYCYPIGRNDKNYSGPRFTGEKAEYFRAEGFYQIYKEADDPIFCGLNEEMYMRCSHYCEVKKLPQDFIRLASSKHSEIEAMKHKGKLIYGVQFHPEKYEEPYKDGEKLLQNFANIVNNFWDNKETKK